MRYSARRQWAHPVLRPGSDDYPNGYSRDDTGIDPPHLLPDGTVEFSITWHPGSRTIRAKMEAGEAVLCGLIYCNETYFRMAMEASPIDPFRAVVRLDTKEVRGRIEIHPLIVARSGTVELTLDEAHEEYGGGRTVLQRGAPLAVDQYWSLDHDPTKPPLESFVQLLADERVTIGRFVLNATLGERQLVIRLHPETYQEFTRIRTEAKARAGLYLPALTAACQRIAIGGVVEDPEVVPTHSWNAVVDRLLANPDPEADYKACYIQRTGENDDLFAPLFGDALESVEPEEAAQRLLGAPLGAMLKRELTEEELVEEDLVEISEDTRTDEA